MNANTEIIKAILNKGLPEPRDIIYIINLKGLDVTSLADELEVTRGNVTNVIYSRYRSLLVAEHIAYRTDLSLRSLWGNRYDHLIERRNKKNSENAA